ncbi:MAG TPA: hypothetical protein PL196_09890 [Burkholderiaceae bacterium]|nr:hypothetical protein [Burkholderiaceae bacterium]
MPLPTDPPEPPERSSTDLQRGALIAASLTAGMALALAALAIAQPGKVPGVALAWLLALATVCAAVGVGWTLWRQGAIVSALREARAGRQALRSLCDTWTFETDGGHRVLGWCPPHGDARRSGAPGGSAGALLWDCFAGDPSSVALLRAQLEAGLPVRSLVVSRAEDGAPPAAARRYELHALPTVDEIGRTSWRERV